MNNYNEHVLKHPWFKGEKLLWNNKYRIWMKNKAI